jgi:Ca2+-binding RTX toxin-like protein
MGNDTVYGGVGNDVVRGGQADDTVYGEDGNDFVSGDRGADMLYGGAGADTFHSFAEAGMDWVADFKASEGDRVNLLAGSTYTVSQEGAHVVIIVDNNAQMVLADTQLSSLPEGWLFVG